MANPLSSERLHRFASTIVAKMREIVATRGWSKARLPGWISAARISTGQVGDTAVFVIENGSDGDLFLHAGCFESDLALLFPQFAIQPIGSGFRFSRGKGLDPPIIAMAAADPAVLMFRPNMGFFDSHVRPRHFIGTFWGLTFQINASDDPGDVVAVRHVPVLTMVHRTDVEQAFLPNGLFDAGVQYLSIFESGEAGNRQQTRVERQEHFALSKARSVIVLGKDNGESLNELTSVRDFLRSKRYDAELIKDLPEIPMMSNEQKVQLWTSASRFVVMIDREPSGHIAEYGTLRGQKTILAFLRPAGRGSTYMIGDDDCDIRFIKHFEFSSSPLEVLDEAIAWAEEFATEKQEYFNQKYPWRKQRSNTA